jgi:hypothetical protein
MRGSPLFVLTLYNIEEWWHFEYGAAQYGPLLGLGDAGAAG